MRIHPVIMAGGAGTRLWPVSRKRQPKQFQRLVTDKTMFQETVLRFGEAPDGVDFAPPSIIGAAAYESLILDQLDEIGVTPGHVVLEPFGRNTAAVAAIAASLATEPGDLALLLPSDHHVADPSAFRAAVADAASVSAEGWITTFGIAARSPETGYGYIRSGDVLNGACRRVESFVEKPTRPVAEGYIADGRYAWNAGIFLFSRDAMLGEMDAHAPDILAQSLEALDAGERRGAVVTLNTAAFEACRSDSIDYAVMEKTSKAAVQGPLECGWSDIGSWSAIAEIATAPQLGDVVALDTENCYLRADGDVLLAAVGVSNLCVVAHDNAVLVLPVDRAQDVKKIVEELKNRDSAQRL